MPHKSAPPLLLHDVIDDVGSVVKLLERAAPYTPLGGWYRPGIDSGAAISPLWFQNDWVHAELRVEGSELFLFHERVMQAARELSRASDGLRVIRDNIVAYEGKISSLKRFKEDVKEVQTGHECGIMIENFNDLKVGDRIENYIIEKIAAKL